MSQALSQAIQQILNAHSDGLTEREIRRAVIEGLGLRCTPREVRETLHTHPDLFVPLAGGVWRSKAAVEAEKVAANVEEVPRERGEVQRPYLADLPPLESFIAFDLETTGVKSERDHIIQIAAVRFVDGRPAPAIAEDGTECSSVFNEYVDLEGREIPFGLKVKLGFTDHPEWEQELARAAPLAEVLERFRHWVGDMPLVAHNVRFDLTFLRQAADSIGWEITNPIVDSMELACLAQGGTGRFRLEELARSLNVGEGLSGGRQVEDWARQQGVGAFSWTGFHNAVVDVLVLAAVVPRLVEAIQKRMVENPLLAGEFARLMGQAAARLGITAPPAAEDRDTVVAELVREDSEVWAADSGQLEPGRGAKSLQEDLLETSEVFLTPEAVRARFEEMVERHGLRRREAQFQMVEHVSRALRDERFMAVEAPTGTGKTFAYLVPAILWARGQGEPVVISTYTRLLQDQMADDLERVRQNLGTDFQAQVLKGMRNYICLERAAAVYAQTCVGDLDEEQRFAWLILLTWLSVTREGLLDELSYWALTTFPVLARLCEALRAEQGECPRKHCPARESCFHRLAYERAQQADVVVMNHALLLSKEWEQAGLLFTRVVVDEAHNLEDAATAAATDEVSWEGIVYLVNRLLDRRSGRGVLIRVRDKVRDAGGQRLIARALQGRSLLATLAEDFGQRLHRYVELNRAQVDPRYGARLALEAVGLDARYYHGKMDDQARKEVQDMFLDGQINVIVATKAFGMGIDKPDIRYVVHYQIPGDIESYFQEAGRAGRDSQVSWCVLLYHEGDLWIHENYFIPKSLPESEQVANVLEWLRRRCGTDEGSPIYVDPREAADALDFDEQRELGIHLHLLEEMGFIRRGVDVTLKASARLLAPLEVVAARAQDVAPGPVGGAIGRVLEVHGIGPVARGELPVVEAALAEGLDPLALDEALYQLALQGLLIYRGFARAFVLTPGPRMLEGARLDLDLGEARRVRGEMEANLAAMRRYAETLEVGDCLREEILRYLGAEKPPTRAGECCSLCDVNLAVPWADESAGEDLTDPGRYQDAKYTILKAVAWDAGLANVRGRAPYGAWNWPRSSWETTIWLPSIRQTPSGRKHGDGLLCPANTSERWRGCVGAQTPC